MKTRISRTSLIGQIAVALILMQLLCPVAKAQLLRKLPIPIPTNKGTTPVPKQSTNTTSSQPSSPNQPNAVPSTPQSTPPDATPSTPQPTAQPSAPTTPPSDAAQ